jgi:putative ABC transport system substrate-binding protein
VRRREFITLLGGAASWPFAVRAQPAAMPVIGFLCSASEAAWAPYVSSFRQGLSERGYHEGRDIAIEYRWADNKLDRLPAMVADLIARRIAVFVAGGGAAPAIAAKKATTTIPIVFAHGSDPVKSGLVSSLNRPGGNVTGVTFLATALVAKRLGLLRELVPGATNIAVLFNPENSEASAILGDLRDATGKLGVTPLLLNARQERDFEAAFATLVKNRSQALLIAGDRLFVAGRDRLAALAAQHAIPTMHDDLLYPAAGGLMTYGPSITAAYRQIGVYTARILRGEKPADLPVMRPTKFDLIVNLRTAKALGLEIPPKLLALTDQVIE